jgi:xanthine dehydrogenase accessory factor
MMLVRSDGSSIGTIGGGAGEASIIEHARHVLVTGEKQGVDIDLSGNLEHTKQGICGGRMHVWLERWQGESALALANEIVASLQAGEDRVLITPYTPTRSPYLSTPSSPLATPDSPAFITPLLPPSHPTHRWCRSCCRSVSAHGAPD